MGVHVRCITLNLEGLSHRWFERRGASLIEHLKPFKPDILCLQETTFRNSSPNYNQSQDLGDQLGLRYVAFSPYGNPIEVMSSDQGGIAVVCRWPLLSIRARRLPSGHDMPPDSRVAQIATVEAPGGPLHVVTTHLSWRPEDVQVRLVQMGLLLDDFVRENWVAPGPEDDPDRRFQCRGVRAGDSACFRKDAGHVSTHASERRGIHLDENESSRGWECADRRLDYIFCPYGVEIHQADVILNQPGTPYLSDHFAVYAELSWKTAA